MITPDHVRNLMAGGDVVLMWTDGGGAVVEIARYCSIDGWVVAAPEEFEPPNEPEQQPGRQWPGSASPARRGTTTSRRTPGRTATRCS